MPHRLLEVDRRGQDFRALAHRADVVLLDNFDDADLERAVSMIAGRALIDVSGGVSLARIPQIARHGVDVISVGALTHSARAIDLGLDWSA